jgi:nitrite reductase/ring-hydroxylating ferredoxin subunit
VEHQGSAIALCNTGGKCYAIQDRCPHRFANLSDGELDGDTVICPKHKGQFDLASGEPTVWVAEPFLLHLLGKLIPKGMRRAKTFSVEQDGDDLTIG